MEDLPPLAAEKTIAVVGAGRLGGVIVRALRNAGYDVYGPLGRADDVPETDITILAVPDAAIESAASRLTGKRGHLSGATELDAVELSIHPLQSFTGTETPAIFHGIGAAIDGRTDDDRALAEQLARTLGMVPFAVDDRAGYHAAASFASNFVLTVLDAAEQLATASGVAAPREILAPLVRTSVTNWVRGGAPAALTGPIARGDDETVERQCEVVHRAAPHLGALFDELVAATRALAQRADNDVETAPEATPRSAVAGTQERPA